MRSGGMMAAGSGLENPLEGIIDFNLLPLQRLVKEDDWSTEIVIISVYRWSAVMRGPWIRRLDGGLLKCPDGGDAWQ